jgi:polysaccharide transporter, PST family
MSTKKKLIENILSLFILQGLNYILPLLTFPYLIRILGTEQYGLLSIVMAFVQYFVIITDYGFNMTATRKVAINKQNNQLLSIIYGQILFIKGALLVVSFLLFVVLVLSIPSLNSAWNIYLISYLTVLGSVLFPVWIFQGLERMKYITVVNIIVKAITTISIFIFIKDDGDLFLTVLIQSSGFVLVGIISTFIIIKRFKITPKFKFNKSDIRLELKEGGHVFMSTLSGNIYGQGAIIITGMFGGYTASGYYAAAQKIVSAIAGLMQPIAQAVYPYLCTLIVESRDRFINIKKQLIRASFAITSCIGVILLVFAKPIVVILTGLTDTEIIILIRISSITVVCIMNNLLLNSFILAYKRYKQMQKMYVTTAIVFLIISIPMTISLKSLGMALCIMTVELFILIRSLYIIREHSTNEREDLSYR